MTLVVKTERDAIYSINVDDHGWIVLDHHGHHGERRLSQANAAALADALLQGIRLSIDRNQIGRPDYHDTDAIRRRNESPLGKAQASVRRIFQ